MHLKSSNKFLRLYNKYDQFIKYCIVGSCSTIIDIGGLYLLVEFGKLPVLPGTVISFCSSVIFGFTVNRIWTFQSKLAKRKQFIKFFTVAFFGLIVTTLLMYVFYEKLKIWYILAKTITSALIFVCSFLAHKNWTYAEKSI